MTGHALPRIARAPDFTLDGLHVLIVDDNADARFILSSLVAQAGARVTDVASANAADSVLNHVLPDVLVTDLAMPRRDGMWLVRRVRARDRRKGGGLPVLAITARDDIYTDTQALSAGFDALLIKPVPARELIATILRAAKA